MFYTPIDWPTQWPVRNQLSSDNQFNNHSIFNMYLKDNASPNRGIGGTTSSQLTPHFQQYCFYLREHSLGSFTSTPSGTSREYVLKGLLPLIVFFTKVWRRMMHSVSSVQSSCSCRSVNMFLWTNKVFDRVFGSSFDVPEFVLRF